MSVDWTAAERAAAKRAAGCRIIEVPALWCEKHRTLAPGNHCQAVTQTLDALAPHVAARERAAVQNFLEKRDRPVIKVETAGEAKLIVDAMEKLVKEARAERDDLAETLRLRSEALNRVAAENDRLRATLARVEALTGGPLSDGYRPYGVQVGREVHMAVLLDDLRAALAGGES